jgi:hypothetical protein
VDNVGSYQLLGPTPDPPYGPTIVSPAPVATAANPTTLYWLDNPNLRITSRHIWLVSTANNVQGPLVTDVYYPVNTPTSSVTYTFTNPKVSAIDIPPDCNVVAVLIHLGSCSPPGESANYTVSVKGDPNSAGWMTVGHLVYIAYTGKMGASPSPSPYYSNSQAGQVELDVEFPPYGDYSPVPNGGSNTYDFTDDPFYKLTGSNCTEVSVLYDYVDYFLYQPQARKAGHPSIWAPVNSSTGYAWNWAGSANWVPSVGLGGGTWTQVSVTPPISSPTPNPVPDIVPTWSSIVTPQGICGDP